MLQVLKALALMNAMRKVLKISSKELAEKIGQSIQAASRKLKELEDEGLIERTLTKDGQFVVITDKGKELLYKEYLDYKRIFEGEGEFVIKGKVFSGLGEGRYYVSLEGYKKQFEEKLGFTPYPGTLNLKIPKEQMFFRAKLDEMEGIKIEGFKTKERTFGDVKAFRCRVNGIEGAIVIPQRTHYPKDVIEIIAPVKLRDVLGLKDGDWVEVEVIV
ncbi:winged helix-turn-helix domain-containing protein/riboflavin kinase [Archaeoglobus profundus]|uniref:Riboflavin kinase n=1 Tax=Archaeoglobus profundus (strain DSM 5631 / JCM 9629 / NBRC 100127 / Av18) TaxID=572546 RepID=D2RDY3_ARCPA|nr:winged helix-turn-helix domain-containing protein/riboflavin kinase [Archaeoglobus profundus]ADB58327.1 transcriptional regulator, MarR family [Archaeoglobus profundus DSM 5631]